MFTRKLFLKVAGILALTCVVYVFVCAFSFTESFASASWAIRQLISSLSGNALFSSDGPRSKESNSSSKESYPTMSATLNLSSLSSANEFWHFSKEDPLKQGLLGSLETIDYSSPEWLLNRTAFSSEYNQPNFQKPVPVTQGNFEEEQGFFSSPKEFLTFVLPSQSLKEGLLSSNTEKVVSHVYHPIAVANGTSSAHAIVATHDTAAHLADSSLVKTVSPPPQEAYSILPNHLQSFDSVNNTPIVHTGVVQPPIFFQGKPTASQQQTLTSTMTPVGVSVGNSSMSLETSTSRSHSPLPISSTFSPSGPIWHSLYGARSSAGKGTSFPVTSSLTPTVSPIVVPSRTSSRKPEKQRLEEERKNRLLEEQRLEEERKQKLLEQQRLEEERKNRLLEEQRLEEERKNRLLEEQRLEEERKQKLLEQQRLEEERKNRLLEEQRLEEERKQKLLEQQRLEEERRNRLLEEQRLEEERRNRLLEEQRLEEERKNKLLEEQRLEEERKNRLLEQQRLEKERKQKLLEEQRLEEERKNKLLEEQRLEEEWRNKLLEEQRLEEERRNRLLEEQRLEEERRNRLLEEQRLEEERENRLLEEQRLKKERKNRLLEDQRLEEERRRKLEGGILDKFLIEFIAFYNHLISSYGFWETFEQAKLKQVKQALRDEVQEMKKIQEKRRALLDSSDRDEFDLNKRIIKITHGIKKNEAEKRSIIDSIEGSLLDMRAPYRAYLRLLEQNYQKTSREKAKLALTVENYLRDLRDDQETLSRNISKLQQRLWKRETSLEEKRKKAQREYDKAHAIIWDLVKFCLQEGLKVKSIAVSEDLLAKQTEIFVGILETVSMEDVQDILLNFKNVMPGESWAEIDRPVVQVENFREARRVLDNACDTQRIQELREKITAGIARMSKLEEQDREIVDEVRLKEEELDKRLSEIDSTIKKYKCFLNWSMYSTNGSEKEILGSIEALKSSLSAMRVQLVAMEYSSVDFDKDYKGLQKLWESLAEQVVAGTELQKKHASKEKKLVAFKKMESLKLQACDDELDQCDLRKEGLEEVKKAKILEIEIARKIVEELTQDVSELEVVQDKLAQYVGSRDAPLTQELSEFFFKCTQPFEVKFAPGGRLEWLPLYLRNYLKLRREETELPKADNKLCERPSRSMSYRLPLRTHSAEEDGYNPRQLMVF